MVAERGSEIEENRSFEKNDENDREPWNTSVRR